MSLLSGVCIENARPLFRTQASFAQIHHPGGAAAVGEDEVGGEVVPAGAAINQHGVGTDDDGVACRDEIGVGIEHGLDCPGLAMLLG